MTRGTGIAVLAATERLSSTALSNEVLDGHTPSMFTYYECPRCGHGIRFSRQDLENATGGTVLRPTDAAAMDRAAMAKNVPGRSFLDWYCQGCGAPRRVYCQPWAGGRHGDHGVHVEWILEAASGVCDDA